MLKMSHDSAL